MLWFFTSLGQTCFSSSESALLTCCVALTVVWQTTGLAVSRQWFLLPFAWGVVGLSVFLLNPIADSTSPFDLREKLLNPNTLALLGGIQVLVTGFSFSLGLRSVSTLHQERWRLLLGVLHCIPPLPILLGGLLAQQMWLSQQVGARPEWGGVMVGVTAVVLLAVCSGGAILLSANRRSQVHLLSGVLLGVLVLLAVTADRSLPTEPSEATTDAAVRSLLPCVLVIGACIAAGVVLEVRRNRRLVASP
ncbi:hypothetical protein FF011L_52950 [Roseimaritima multifibrata]|uniref:Uncharacterized protein n=1 Tax=Roseimaritima multifibrata TaxID=1930274 RepID=A0A517MNN0_9BACT|nr:hypothetical protein [Roseimaritima multifibrata]QDS96484.1 hypothetical protein FF011L_52950 [Roseimaritima multifibrata]